MFKSVFFSRVDVFLVNCCGGSCPRYRMSWGVSVVYVSNLKMFLCCLNVYNRKQFRERKKIQLEEIRKKNHLRLCVLSFF